MFNGSFLRWMLNALILNRSMLRVGKNMYRSILCNDDVIAKEDYDTFNRFQLWRLASLFLLLWTKRKVNDLMVISYSNMFIMDNIKIPDFSNILVWIKDFQSENYSIFLKKKHCLCLQNIFFRYNSHLH